MPPTASYGLEQARIHLPNIIANAMLVFEASLPSTGNLMQPSCLFKTLNSHPLMLI
jgi:hypothetical protein